jgi:glycosyltransferase involved in cell wall biosynthesis
VIREVVEDARGGIFVQPGDPEALVDAIKLLANQPERRKDMGMAAREYLRDNFRRADQADAMEELFKALSRD